MTCHFTHQQILMQSQLSQQCLICGYEDQLANLRTQLQSVRADLHLTLKTNAQLLDTIEKMEQEKHERDDIL